MNVDSLARFSVENNSLETIISVATCSHRTVMSKQWYKDDFSKGFVYFLIYRRQVVYIGQSTKMERLSQHPDKEYDEIAYIICDNFASIENMLIKHFQPIYNRCYLTKNSNRQKLTTSLEADFIKDIKKIAAVKSCKFADVINEIVGDYLKNPNNKSISFQH